MTPAIRAYRILRPMKNYQKAEASDQWPAELAHGRLGAPIGAYRNPGPDGELIGIFEDGIAWREGSHVTAIRFAELVNVEFPNGKQSRGLLLIMRDGEQRQIPITGGRGQFLDSMEMARFVRRVIEDMYRPQK